MKCWAFDVDETLEISNGPVPISSLLELRALGHVVGLCGNGKAFVEKVPNWYDYISFNLLIDIGYLFGFQGMFAKSVFMKCFRETFFTTAEEYVLVGNVFGEKNSLGFVCGSADSLFAEQAGWRFIKEDAFAAGER